MKRLLLLTAAFLASPAAAQSVAITHARLVIGDGSAPIEDGTVLVQNGKVVAAGRNVAIPQGVETVDAGGRYVTPGIVAGFTRMGIIEVDGVDETNDAGASNSPFHAGIDIAPAVNPRTSSIALNRAEGITRAVVAPTTRGSVFAGQGAIIDLGAEPSTVFTLPEGEVERHARGQARGRNFVGVTRHRRGGCAPVARRDASGCHIRRINHIQYFFAAFRNKQ